MGDRANMVAARDEKVRIMSAHAWKEVEELLHQAMALAPEQRPAFLDAACGSDADLRAELNSLLLVGDDLSDAFLDSPLRGVLERQIGEIESTSMTSARCPAAKRTCPWWRWIRR